MSGNSGLFFSVSKELVHCRIVMDSCALPMLDDATVAQSLHAQKLAHLRVIRCHKGFSIQGNDGFEVSRAVRLLADLEFQALNQKLSGLNNVQPRHPASSFATVGHFAPVSSPEILASPVAPHHGA